MKNLLEALGDNIKKQGAGWVARCPVHNDSDFAMSIGEGRSGGVVAHCYACGANGLDLYKALDLDLEELFGGKKKDGSFIPSKVLDEYTEDRFFKAIYDSDVKKGVIPTIQDKRRIKLAECRMRGIENKYGETNLLSYR